MPRPVLVYVPAQIMRFAVLGLTWVLGCAVGVDAVPTDETAPPTSHDAGVKGDANTTIPSDDAGMGADVGLPPPPPPSTDSGTTTTTCTPASGTLVSYDFTGEPGNQTTTAASSTMSGVTATGITRATVINAVSGANSMNGSNWSTAGVDATRYYTFTITPPASCALDLASIAVDTKASTTGPASASVATSDDSFTSHASVTVNTTATATLSVTGSTKAVEVRVYFFGAGGTSGTARMESTLSVTGSVM